MLRMLCLSRMRQGKMNLANPFLLRGQHDCLRNSQVETYISCLLLLMFYNAIM